MVERSRILTAEKAVQTRELFAGRVFGDSEIVDFLLDGTKCEIDRVVFWRGNNIQVADSPLVRIGGILRDRFDGLDEGKKEVFLGSCSQYVFVEPRLKFLAPMGDKPERLRDFYVAESLSFGNAVSGAGELVLATLRFTNGDIEASRQVLDLRSLRKESHDGRLHLAGRLLLGFHSPEISVNGYSSEVASSAIGSDFERRNPKFRVLSFWLDVDAGFYVAKSLDQLTEDIFPKTNGVVKTEIVRYLLDLIPLESEDRVGGKIRGFFNKNRGLFNAVRSEYPDSAFVKLYSEALERLKL